MSEEPQLEITFDSPPSTPKKKVRPKSRRGRLAFSPVADEQPDKKQTKERRKRKPHRDKVIFSPPRVNGNSTSKESPVKKQTIEEVSKESQNGESIIHRNRQFEICSPAKNQPAAVSSLVTQILNIEEEVIASGAENKVTKLTIRYHEGNSTTLVVRQNHKGRDPHDSPAVDFVQAQHHPLIAKRIDKKPGFDEDGLPYVKEYYDHCAGSLTDIPISYAEVPAFFLAIVQAIKWLHKLGYTHLDLKPDNILVGFDGLPKIADLDNLGRINGSATPVNGTESYMPPEVTHNNSKKPIKNRQAVDAWSLGCILYYLYMREAPPVNKKGEFLGFSEELERKIGGKAPRILRIIEKLLSTDPQVRLEMFNRIGDKAFFKRVDKKNLLACLKHGKNFSEIYNIQKEGSYSDQLSKYQEMREQCNKINLNIDEAHQKAIDDEAPYAALKTLLRSKELAKFKDDELKKERERKPDLTEAEKKKFFSEKEVEFLGVHLVETIGQKSQELSKKIADLKKIKLNRTQNELEHLISETKIKMVVSERFKDNEILCKKIINYQMPDSKASLIYSKKEWDKKFSKLHALFGVNNKLKQFGLFIARYHRAKTSADKIKWALYLLSQIQTYPRANQIPVLEDLRKKVIDEIKILNGDHQMLSPETQQQLGLNIPKPDKAPMTPCPKEAKAAGQVEEDDLISNSIWLKNSEYFYIHWLNFKAGRKDVQQIDVLVEGYSINSDVDVRFKYARDIIITTEHWLTMHKSSARYEAVEELQRCAIYTLNSLLRSLKMSEAEMTKLLSKPLKTTMEDAHKQTVHSSNRSGFFACFSFGKSKETVNLPEVTP